MRRLGPLLLLVPMLLAARPASPFQYDSVGGKVVRWPEGSTTVYYAASVPPARLADWQQACAVWSGVTGSSWRFIWGGASPSVNVKDSNNGNNDIRHESGATWVRAYVVLSYPARSAEITDRDIIWNEGYQALGYPPYPGPYAAEDYRTVAIHELGHVLGLLHDNSTIYDSIMNANTIWRQWTPFIHSIFADDRAGVRFLYPSSGEPPPPPPPGVPDAAVERVFFTPPDAAPGDPIEITYEIRNMGTGHLSPFSADFRLGGGFLLDDGDFDIGTRFELPLAAGQGRTRTLTTTAPASLLPGTYRVAVIVDPGETTLDVSRGNNYGASLNAIRVEREPIAVPPTCRVEGDLGPMGRDTFLLDLAAGARVKIKARIEPGANSLALYAPEEKMPRAATEAGRKAKIATQILADGTTRLVLDSGHPAGTSYRLKIRTKPYRFEDERTITGEARIPITIHEGSKVSVKVRTLDGSPPAVSLPGVETRVKSRKGGARVKLGSFVAARTETLELVLAPGGSPATVRYRVDVRPAKAIEIER